MLSRFPGFGPVALSLFPDPVTGRYKVAEHSVRRAAWPEDIQLAWGADGILWFGLRRGQELFGIGRTLLRMDWAGCFSFIFFRSLLKQLWPVCHQWLISFMTLPSVKVGR